MPLCSPCLPRTHAHLRAPDYSCRYGLPGARQRRAAAAVDARWRMVWRSRWLLSSPAAVFGPPPTAARTLSCQVDLLISEQAACRRGELDAQEGSLWFGSYRESAWLLLHRLLRTVR